MTAQTAIRCLATRNQLTTEAVGHVADMDHCTVPCHRWANASTSRKKLFLIPSINAEHVAGQALRAVVHVFGMNRPGIEPKPAGYSGACTNPQRNVANLTWVVTL